MPDTDNIDITQKLTDDWKKEMVRDFSSKLTVKCPHCKKPYRANRLEQHVKECTHNPAVKRLINNELRKATCRFCSMMFEDVLARQMHEDKCDLNPIAQKEIHVEPEDIEFATDEIETQMEQAKRERITVKKHLLPAWQRKEICKRRNYEGTDTKKERWYKFLMKLRGWRSLDEIYDMCFDEMGSTVFAPTKREMSSFLQELGIRSQSRNIGETIVYMYWLGGTDE